MSENVTAQLAELICHSQPDDLARNKARTGLLDFTAVALPLLRDEILDSGWQKLKKLYPQQNSETRALLLGYAGHALDFDDFHADFRGHVGTVVLPALLALAAERQVTAAAFLDAWIIGVETAGRLGLAISQRHYERGFHNTATLGTLAATAAAARLLKVTTSQATVALGIAATSASGLRAQFGSAIKPLHAGLAARSAVMALRLAQADFGGQASGVIEAFLAACGGESSDASLLLHNWGQPWRIVTPGLEFKPYATCSGTHSAADAALKLRQRWLEEGRQPHEFLTAIAHIEVAFPPGGDTAASVREPRSGIEARFSLEYVIASALLHGELTLADFAEGELDADTARLAAKVRRCPDESAPPDAINPSARFHQVALCFADRPAWRCRVTRQQSIATPPNLSTKLRSCLPSASAEEQQKIEQLCQLREDDALSQLLSLFIKPAA
ncbi:MmgE/PrpD family protein [Kalamiella sp. sgz302252]|uniref:MmgE/PrpD family protein n=1 Tax=Pantoea sp. sgz302252 TaxID=3341827 RepID=UPI0036D3DC71